MLLAALLNLSVGHLAGAWPWLAASAALALSIISPTLFLLGFFFSLELTDRFFSFGAEEAGCRGSRRYVARHLDELRRLDVRQFNYETIVQPEAIILSSETSGAVKVSPEMVKGVAAGRTPATRPVAATP